MGKQKREYLSPAASSTLAASPSYEKDDGYSSPTADVSDDAALTCRSASSCTSSAPPSPKGSVDTATTATTSSSLSSSSSDGASALSCCRDAPDPYADVRERLEALSRRDKATHVHRAEGGTAEAAAAAQRSVHPDITVFAAITTYLGYVVLILAGHARDICALVFRKGRYLRGGAPPAATTRHAPLLKSWENFYTRRLYHRIQDCFNRPIASRPGAVIAVLERVSFDGNKTMAVLGRPADRHHPSQGAADERAASYRAGPHYAETADGRVVRACLNLGSYNYLGFADDWDVTCRDAVAGALAALPPAVGSCRAEFGTTALHRRVEDVVATFVGKEAAVVLNMGFNVNATVIPALTSRGDLIVSDALNHTSIVNGARASGAAIRTFRHNDVGDLELVLREAIVYGQPRTRRPWRRILVVVEGIYSMEGEYCDLRGVVTVCKKYGAHVYLDEAHSIGAMGATGRGCCEFTGVDPGDVDVMMGTFTKSFGGMGGYIAADAGVVDELRRACAGSAYHNSLSPVVCQQIITSFQVITGEDGTSIGRRKLDALRDNSNYFRMRLGDLGLHVVGHYDSPVVPVMLYNPTKIAAFSRECLKRGLAVVVVGFPAVPILMSRARFCISAGHTRGDLDRALAELDEIAELLKLRYARSTFG